MNDPQTNTRELLRRYACQVILCQDEVARTLRLGVSDMKCYNILNSYGAMSPGELARMSGFTTGGVTKILDRLEAHGALRRVAEKGDRRSLLIELLSPKASTAQTQPTVDFELQTAKLVERYSDQEKAVILDFLEHGGEVLQTMTQQMRESRKTQK